jgi:tetratricopeptide (TPR) repeat protein
MRKLFLRSLCIVCVIILTLSTVGCSGVLDRMKNIGKSTPEKQPAKTEPTKTEPTKTEPKISDVQSLIQKGKDQRKAGKLNEAIATFKQALEVDPGNAEAKTLLAETQREREELIERHLKQGIEFFTNDSLQEAMEEWNAVLGLDPNNKEAIDYKERTQKQLDALK